MCFTHVSHTFYTNAPSSEIWDILNYFKDSFINNLTVWMSSKSKMYFISALLRNDLTCFYGNRTSDYFNLEPPTLEESFI